ncbi:hypothetical protein A1D22_04395 [Pasteurellaceae bacterium LFhippo2]|nr:hypothetical protein [Pasteurellaceae bacterium LFhippo2]
MAQPQQDFRLETLISAAIVRCQSTPKISTLSFADMQFLGQKIQEKAKLLKIDVVCSIVDKNGVQRFYFAMPNALLVSQTLAYQKAYTAVAMQMPTDKLNPLIQPNQPLFSLTQNSNITGIGGGFPCWVGQELVAGIGVSGGSVAQDMQIVWEAIEDFCLAKFRLDVVKGY